VVEGGLPGLGRRHVRQIDEMDRAIAQDRHDHRDTGRWRGDEFEARKWIVPIRDRDRLSGLDQVERLTRFLRLQAVPVRIDLRELAGRVDVDEDKIALLLGRDAQRNPASGCKFHIGQDR